MNTKAMFEALLKIIDTIDRKHHVYIEDVYAIRNIAQKALMTKPRNCDIGDFGERSRRFRKFCLGRDCEHCPITKKQNKLGKMIRCSLIWDDEEYEGVIK